MGGGGRQGGREAYDLGRGDRIGGAEAGRQAGRQVGIRSRQGDRVGGGRQAGRQAYDLGRDTG